MRLTLRHTYSFGAAAEAVGPELVQPDAWDAARSLPGPFELPRTREEWERRAAAPELAVRARDVAAVAARVGARTVCSYGVGAAALELNLARVAPHVALTCTDYAPRTVERLRALFPEAEVVRHDLRLDAPLAAGLHLLHRVDTELTGGDWRRVLARFDAPVLFAPALVLTWRSAARELARHARRPRAARAGYVRTEDALRLLWSASHSDERVSVGELTGFLLAPRRRPRSA